MKQLRFILPILAILVVALVILLSPTSHHITILVEGQAMPLTTSANTVQEALQDTGITLSPEDQVTPDLNTRLSEGMQIELIQASRITLFVDGGKKHLTTISRIPAEWLDEIGITLLEGDQLAINGEAAGLDQPIPYQTAISAEVVRSVPFSLVHAGERISLRSAAPTVGQALWEAGYILSESDLVEPAPETPLTEYLSVQLTPGKQIQVETDGKHLNLTTSANSVGEALSQVGLSLQGLDYSIPDTDAPLPTDGNIQIVRVKEDVLITQEPIAFTTTYQPVPELEIDNFNVIQTGQIGVQAQRVRIRFENGEEISREVEDQWTLIDPVDRIEGYGTQIVIRTEMTADGPIEYWRKVELYATSYSPCNLGVDWCGYTTAAGDTMRKGLAGVKPAWFRVMVGQYVYVPNYGPAKISDTGASINNYWIDLAYTDEEYIGWHTWTPVYFLTPVPPEENILYVLP